MCAASEKPAALANLSHTYTDFFLLKCAFLTAFFCKSAIFVLVSAKLIKHCSILEPV